MHREINPRTYDVCTCTVFFSFSAVYCKCLCIITWVNGTGFKNTHGKIAATSIIWIFKKKTSIDLYVIQLSNVWRQGILTTKSQWNWWQNAEDHFEKFMCVPWMPAPRNFNGRNESQLKNTHKAHTASIFSSSSSRHLNMMDTRLKRFVDLLFDDAHPNGFNARTFTQRHTQRAAEKNAKFVAFKMGIFIYYAICRPFRGRKLFFKWRK